MAVRSRQLAHPWAAALLCLALFSLLARAAGAGDGSTRGWPLSDWAGGRASSYGSLLEAQGSAVTPLKQGACKYGASGDAWPSWHTAALGPSNRLLNDLPLGGCGACFEVQCGNGSAVQGSPCAASGNASIVVAVVDACPGCADDQLALHPLAVSQLAPLSREAIPVRYRQVACRPPGNVIVTVEQYSVLRGGWMRLHVSQVAGSGGIQAVWLRSTAPAASHRASDGDGAATTQAATSPGWKLMANTDGASWELSRPPPPPLDVLIYNSAGQKLLARALIPSAGATGDFQTNAQFSALPPSPAPPASANANASPGGAQPSANASQPILLANFTQSLTKDELLDLSLSMPELQDAAMAAAAGTPQPPVVSEAPANSSAAAVASPAPSPEAAAEMVAPASPTASPPQQPPTSPTSAPSAEAASGQSPAPPAPAPEAAAAAVAVVSPSPERAPASPASPPGAQTAAEQDTPSPPTPVSELVATAAKRVANASDPDIPENPAAAANSSSPAQLDTAAAGVAASLHNLTRTGGSPASHSLSPPPSPTPSPAAASPSPPPSPKPPAESPRPRSSKPPHQASPSPANQQPASPLPPVPSPSPAAKQQQQQPSPVAPSPRPASPSPSPAVSSSPLPSPAAAAQPSNSSPTPAASAVSPSPTPTASPQRSMDSSPQPIPSPATDNATAAQPAAGGAHAGEQQGGMPGPSTPPTTTPPVTTMSTSGANEEPLAEGAGRGGGGGKGSSMVVAIGAAVGGCAAMAAAAGGWLLYRRRRRRSSSGSPYGRSYFVDNSWMSSTTRRRAQGTLPLTAGRPGAGQPAESAGGAKAPDAQQLNTRAAVWVAHQRQREQSRPLPLTDSQLETESSCGSDVYSTHDNLLFALDPAQASNPPANPQDQMMDALLLSTGYDITAPAATPAGPASPPLLDSSFSGSTPAPWLPAATGQQQQQQEAVAESGCTAAGDALGPPPAAALSSTAEYELLSNSTKQTLHQTAALVATLGDEDMPSGSQRSSSSLVTSQAPQLELAAVASSTASPLHTRPLQTLAAAPSALRTSPRPPPGLLSSMLNSGGSMTAQRTSPSAAIPTPTPAARASSRSPLGPGLPPRPPSAGLLARRIPSTTSASDGGSTSSFTSAGPRQSAGFARFDMKTTGALTLESPSASFTSPAAPQLAHGSPARLPVPTNYTQGRSGSFDAPSPTGSLPSAAVWRLYGGPAPPSPASSLPAGSVLETGYLSASSVGASEVASSAGSAPAHRFNKAIAAQRAGREEGREGLASVGRAPLVRYPSWPEAEV